MAGAWMGVRRLTGIGWTGPSWTWHTCIYTHTLETLYAWTRKTYTQAFIRTIYTYAGRGVPETSIQVKCGRKSVYGRKWRCRASGGGSPGWTTSTVSKFSCPWMHIYTTQALTHTIKKGNAIPLFGWGWFGWLRLVGMRIGLSGLYVGYTLWNSEKS